MIEACMAEWPTQDSPSWHVYTGKNGTKLATREVSALGRPFLHTIEKMIDAEFLASSDQYSFPDLNLYGAGLHEIPIGSHLSPHLDSDHIPYRPKWRRSFSTILYFNSVDGGELVLDGEEIETKRNRMVTFECNDNATHSVNTVKPSPFNRRSASVFWWVLDDSPTKRPQALFFPN